ncbi:MAG: hypothetical protein SGPRY_005827, partial [Prymnesium sp.]
MLYGDFEVNGAFAQALRQRSSGGEIILTVTDWRHQRWAHNLLLNLRALSISHHLILSADPKACEALDARMPREVGCGHSSWLRGASESHPKLARGLKAFGIQANHVYHLWWQRWHYLARAVGMGYSALSLDSDISLRVDPYAMLHGALRGFEMVVAIDSARSGKQ